MSCSSSSSPFRIPLSLWCEASGMCKILTEQISLSVGWEVPEIRNALTGDLVVSI